MNDLAKNINFVLTPGKFGYLLTWPIFLILFSVNSQAYSQSTEATIRVDVDKGKVFVFNTFKIPTGYGYNIYRSDGSSYSKLNTEPLKGAQNIAEFMGQAGEYVPLIQKALELDNPQAVYLRLRSSRLAANLATFYYPDVARALGHLYVDSTAAIGGEVTYRVELVDEHGQLTGEKIEKTLKLVKPSAARPVNLKAEHSRRQVTLTWSYPKSSVQNDDKIVRFNVYDQQKTRRRKINKNPIVRINNFDEFTQTFTVPRIGTTLHLVVEPVDLTMHEGPSSTVLTYTVSDETPPAIVSGLRTMANDNGEVEITWPVSTEADAKGYNLFRAERIKGDYEKLNDKPIALLETFYVDHPPKTKTSYFYRISAVDSAGNESKRSNAAKADVEDHVPPAAPTTFQAIAQEDGTVKLTWESPKQEPGFKSYIILRKQMTRFAGKANAQLNTDNVTGTTFIDKGEANINLAEGARYRYQIFAEDSARNFSDTLTAVVKIPDNTPPQPPTTLKVENHDGVWAVLRWNASVSTDVTNYILMRGSSPGRLVPYRTLPVQKRMIRDDSVEVGHAYYYAVAALDSLGNKGNPTEIERFLMKDFTPPRAIRNVRATRHSNKVDITWEPSTAHDLKGYRIYTSSIPTGVYQPFTNKLLSDTKFSSTDIENSDWITIRAIDSSGNESKDSKPVTVYVPDKTNR